MQAAGTPSKGPWRQRFSALLRESSPALLSSLLHGGLFALSLPGVVHPWVGVSAAFLSLLPLVWLVKARGGRLALFLGLWLGQVPLWALQQWWVLDVSELGFFPLVALQACWAAVFVFVVQWARRGVPWLPLPLLAAVAWAGVEFFRAQVFLTGYAWGLGGDALIEVPVLAAPARVGGLSFIAFLMMLVVAGAWRLFAGQAEGLPRRWVGAVCVSAGLVGWIASAVLGRPVPVLMTSVRAGVVQTNLAQSNKIAWSIADEVRDFRRFMELTREASGADGTHGAPDFLVWPETMAPGLTLDAASLDALRRAQVYFPVPAGVAGEQGTNLGATALSDALLAQQREIGIPMLVGEEAIEGLVVKQDAQGRVDWAQDRRFNSAYLIERGEVQPARYDKIHLTPFGEIMPVISRWGWLEDRLLAVAAGGMRFDLDEGKSLTVFEVPAPNLKSGRVRLVTPICFESTDPALCRRLVFDGWSRRADVVVNLTNDGWLGDSDLAKRQHLRAARWRAFELATPVVRAANTGFSAVIGEDGRVIEQLGSRVDGVLRADVGIHPGTGATVYARCGDWAGWSGLWGAALAAGLGLLRSRGAARKPG
ncbi:MAG: apolipoprotein N-acyltransferase [Phycisphaerales bacterium]